MPKWDFSSQDRFTYYSSEVAGYVIALLILVVLPLVSICLIFIDSEENPKTMKMLKKRVGMMNMDIKDNSSFNLVFILRRIVIVVLALYLANYPGIQV